MCPMSPWSRSVPPPPVVHTPTMCAEKAIQPMGVHSLNVSLAVWSIWGVCVIRASERNEAHLPHWFVRVLFVFGKFIAPPNSDSHIFVEIQSSGWIIVWRYFAYRTKTDIYSLYLNTRSNVYLNILYRPHMQRRTQALIGGGWGLRKIILISFHVPSCIFRILALN